MKALVSSTFLAFAATLCSPAVADGQFVTYVMLSGRYVELTGTPIPCGKSDGFLAVESSSLSNGKAGQDDTDLRAYCWQTIGHNIVLYRNPADITLPDSAIKVETIDRAPSERESSSQPAPA